jgi:2-polyprenyl-3-methyl-5-hydroxy-6-metoxy-1,4-benzoquinol methylase
LALITACLCGGSSFEPRTKHGIAVKRCACGIVHQRLDTTPQALLEWYRDTYMAQVYQHSYKQDAKAAKARISAYGDRLKGRILDVGCGNGAFVDACTAGHKDIRGQDLSAEQGRRFTYSEPLAECHFPNGHFDTVTMHDVLEHVPGPKEMLAEVRRILRPCGTLLLEFPDFNSRRHWKKTEHLWMLDQAQVSSILDDAGFTGEYFTRPVEGKLTFYCRARSVVRPSVLVPPGIGDSYWSIVKLPGLLKRIGAESANVWIADDGGHKRSLEWLRKIPWIHAAGYKPVARMGANGAFHQAYMTAGRYLFAGGELKGRDGRPLDGIDHFLAFNGQMRFGADLDALEPGWGAEWFPPLFQPLEERAKMAEYLEGFGPYVVAYFVEHGMYRSWLKDMPLSKISKALHYVEAAGYKVVLMGAEWDSRPGGLPHDLQQILTGTSRNGGPVNLCGETTIPEMFALLRGASGVIGWPAGNTFMGVMLRTPTLLFWNSYFKDRRFWANSCPPESRGSWYTTMDTASYSTKGVEEWLENL